MVSYQEQIEWMATSSVNAESLLEGPPKPTGTAFAVVWQWFSQLQLERQTSSVGIQAFSSMQILAWAKLERLRLPLWATRCLRRLDTAYISAMSVEDKDILTELQIEQGD